MHSLTALHAGETWAGASEWSRGALLLLNTGHLALLPAEQYTQVTA